MARIALTHLLGAMLLWPAMAHAEIEQRQVVSAIASAPSSEGSDVLTLASDNGCGGRQARMNAASVGLDEEHYAAMKTQLAPLIRDKSPLLMRIKSCPAADAMPVISKLGGCEQQACLDGKARLYLNHNLSRSEVKEHARYALVVPLLPGKTPGTWQVEVFHVREGEPRRLSGQVNAPDYLRGKLVGNYAMAYPHDQVELLVEQDGRGVQEGTQTRYYPDGQLAMRATWRNGVQEGEQRLYHDTGKLSEVSQYHNGARADGLLETFDRDGKLRTRMTQRLGQADGELLLFYPDGKVQSRSLYANGIITGPSTDYFPDGTVRRSVRYVNGEVKQD